MLLWEFCKQAHLHNYDFQIKIHYSYIILQLECMKYASFTGELAGRHFVYKYENSHTNIRVQLYHKSCKSHSLIWNENMTDQEFVIRNVQYVLEAVMSPCQLSLNMTSSSVQFCLYIYCTSPGPNARGQLRFLILSNVGLCDLFVEFQSSVIDKWTKNFPQQGIRLA